jgi:soluble lytic murein transglycosylase-like protein
MYRWITTPEGYVEVDLGDGVYARIVPPVGVGSWSARLERVWGWRDLVGKYAAKWGVPPWWVLAVMTVESGGDPHAENACCVGLLAIHLAAHHQTREAMLDPDQNLDYGTSLLASSIEHGLDLPAAASVHNAGSDAGGQPHPSTTSPWGMREETPGGSSYIELVVRAANYFLDRLVAETYHPEPPAPIPAGAPALIPFGLGALGGYYLVRKFLPTVVRG